jgi:sec-independent protein translocase protein TatB
VPSRIKEENMFGIGFGEMLIIAVILLIAVGPKQLPSLMKTVGKGMRDVRRAADDLRRSTGIDELLRDEELRNPLKMTEPPPKRPLTAAELERESPREGIDVEEARARVEAGAPVEQAVAAADLAREQDKAPRDG